MTKDILEQLNQAYFRPDKKARELVKLLKSQNCVTQYGYFNGHYHKDKCGDYKKDYYPIPVISVVEGCDIEINFDSISISTKLKRADALEFSFEKLSGYNYEVYGVEDFLEDYYCEGNTVAELKQKIVLSSEKEIGFSFQFDFEADLEMLAAFVQWLCKEHFIY